MTSAAWWFRHQTAGLLRELRDSRWQVVLAVSPDRDGMTSRVWPRGIDRWPQRDGDLGDRMGRIFRSFPPGPVVIIGADIPGISRADIWDAFQALGRADAVFGPAPDGGYWLVGMKRSAPPPRTLFQGVRWSSGHALADSEASIPGLRIAHVATRRDVDQAADLRSF